MGALGSHCGSRCGLAVGIAWLAAMVAGAAEPAGVAGSSRQSKPSAGSAAPAGEVLSGFARSLEKPPQGILALTSCAPGEVSMEAKELGHGVFMHFVMEGLAGKADHEGGNDNGWVSLLELFRYANVNTKRYAARLACFLRNSTDPTDPTDPTQI